MTVNIICDKDAILGIIGFETDDITGLIRSGSEPGTIRVDSVVKHEKLIELRDKLLEMFPIEKKAEDVPEWRREGEWKEVALEEAREGDYAEFDNTLNHSYEVGQLKESGPNLILDPEKMITPKISRWRLVVRRYDGTMADAMENLHIWRKLDPHRFDEPKGKGYYTTQSGIIFRNEGADYKIWYQLTGKDYDGYKLYGEDWNRVLKMLDDSEFPLVKLTPETLRKAVAE